MGGRSVMAWSSNDCSQVRSHEAEMCLHQPVKSSQLIAQGISPEP